LTGIGGPLVALLLGSGLGLQVARDVDLFGPRHAAGAIDGLSAIASELPADAVVLFPAGPAGNQLAMPLDMVFGRPAFALPARNINPAIARGIARLEDEGRAVYWAQDGPIVPVLPEGATAVRTASVQVRYTVADNGPVPPPLQLRPVEHNITLYRLASGPPSAERAALR